MDMGGRPGAGVGPQGTLKEGVRDMVMTEMRQYFRPEFLNRVDDIVLFKPLRLDEIERIVDLLTEELRVRLADRRIQLEIDEEARKFVASEGYDPVFGARPLKRFLQRELETQIARALIAGDAVDGSTIRVGVAGGTLDFSITSPGTETEEA